MSKHLIQFFCLNGILLITLLPIKSLAQEIDTNYLQRILDDTMFIDASHEDVSVTELKRSRVLSHARERGILVLQNGVPINLKVFKKIYESGEISLTKIRIINETEEIRRLTKDTLIQLVIKIE